MKKLILTTLSVFSLLFSNGQIINDNVSIGAGYPNQIWYSLQNDEVATAAKSEWDLAFEISGFASSIRFNHMNGGEVMVYPKGDSADWNNVDTTGITEWPLLFNSDTSWEVGAFNLNADPSNEFDLGWGVYSMTTHQVLGDSFYIVKTASGDYKKLIIESLISSIYTFKLADLDNSNEITRTLTKGDYVDKNFGYYNIEIDEILDREPFRNNWDLLFTQYAAIIPNYGGYPSTGILQNSGVKVAQAYPINDVSNFEDYESQSFLTNISSIGRLWKSYDFGTNAWLIEDSTVYFIQDKNEDIWKVILTGFSSATGQFDFSKQKLLDADTVGNDTLNAINNLQSKKSFLELFPNPSSNGQVTIAFDSKNESTQLVIRNINGDMVRSENIIGNGLRTKSLNISDLNSGIYLVTINTGLALTTKRLIIN